MTEASDERPVKRTIKTKYNGDLVVELRARTLVIRPKRSRKGGTGEVEVNVSVIYDRALMARGE